MLTVISFIRLLKRFLACVLDKKNRGEINILKYYFSIIYLGTVNKSNLLILCQNYISFKFMSSISKR